MTSNTKHATKLAELALLNYMKELGFKGMRVGASGAGGKKKDESRGDLLVGNGWIILSLELKTSSKDSVYVRCDQVDGQIEFAKAFSAVPLIVFKPARKEYRVFSASDGKRCGTTFRFDYENGKFLSVAVNDLVQEMYSIDGH